MPRWLAAALGGGLTTAAFAPLNLWPGIVLGPALLLWSIRDASPAQAARIGWLFGFAHFLSGIWWVLISTHVYGGAGLGIALLLLVMLAAYLALFPALSAWLMVMLAPRQGLTGLLLVWPGCWLAGEFARDLVFDGFPWFSLGYVATEFPGGLSLAALIGVHGISAVLAAVAGLLLVLMLGPRRWVAALALPLLIGILLVLPPPSHWTTPKGEPLRLSLVQGSIPQDQKWRFENREPTLQLYHDLTDQAWPADLVIWPEVAIPAAHEQVLWYFEEQDALARAQGGTLFYTVITRHNGKSYNTIYAIGEDHGVGPQRYVKRHLVPFGEYIPAPDWIKPLFDVLRLPFPGIATGLDGQDMLHVKGHAISMSICFEDVFPLEVRETARRSAFLVNVTNDAWFAGSAAPAQHLQISRLRAAESGRAMMRVANTGISAMIDADGQVEQQLDWGVRGILRGQVQPREGETPYHQFGRVPLNLYLLLALLLGLATRRGLIT